MNTEQLEIHLLSQTEKQNIDFKYPIEWDVSKFAKHFLAMSNIQNGGHLIIGVEQNGSVFKRLGVTQEIKDSYNIDIMRDNLKGISDPPINFEVFIVKDKNNTEFVIIKVLQFTNVPLICITEKYNLRLNTIYYRNNEKRIESAPISKSYDLRNLLTLSGSLIRSDLNKLGYTIKNTDRQQFNEELGDL